MQTLTIATLFASRLLYADVTAPLIEIHAFEGFSGGWSITVSLNGRVEADAIGNPDWGARYTLSRDQMADFTAMLERDRPWELSGNLGIQIFEGPTRTVRTEYRGKRGEFILHTTPENFAKVYRERLTELGRGLRVCEAVRKLAMDARFKPCVDE